MKIETNVDLSKRTTFKMGGQALKMYIPENEADVVAIFNNCVSVDYIIGGGSNLLINDKGCFEAVIDVSELNNELKCLGDGRFYVGASVRLQKLISYINENGYGGIEYLFSVPGLVGGAVYMNAGRGRKYNCCLSDYIESVECISNGIKKVFSKDACKFSYRYSIFHEMDNTIITGVTFKFDLTDKVVSEKKIKERIQLCKDVQDMSYPNFGTVFCESNGIIIRIVRMLGLGYKNGICFSKKTKNWMLHRENGSFEQAIKLIERVHTFHKFLGQKCRTEVQIWK